MNAEFLRRLHNIVTVGTVLEVNPPKMRLQIGDNETDWVTIPAIAAGKVKIWRCPTKGEQFIIASPSGDHRNARPICAMPSDENPPPSNNPDEVLIQFNDTDYLSVDTVGSTATFKITNLNLDIQSVSLSGEFLANGLITSLLDVLANAISLAHHQTSGIKLGNDIGGVPT